MSPRPRLGLKFMKIMLMFATSRCLEDNLHMLKLNLLKTVMHMHTHKIDML